MLNAYNIERKEVMVEEQKDEDCQDRKGFISGATGGFDKRQQADHQPGSSIRLCSYAFPYARL